MALLEKLFSNLDTLVAYLDPEFNFIRVNAAFAAADHRPAAEFVGQNYFALYPDAETAAQFRQALASRRPYRAYSQRCCHTANQPQAERYWDWTLCPIVAEDGTVATLILLLTDATERVLAERQGAASEQRFRMLFDHIADAVFILDLQGRILEVNAVSCQRLGYCRDELLGMTVQEIDAPDVRGQIPDKLQELQRTGQLTLRTVHLCRDGNTIPTEVNARVVDYGGQPAVLSIARDISARMRDEQALREGKENLRALLNAISESVALVDRHYNTLVINDTGARRLGSYPAALLGESIVAPLPPATASRRQSHMDVVAATKRSARFEDEHDGIVFDSRYYPVLDSAGECQRIAVYSADITEKRRLERTERLFNELDRAVIKGLQLESLTQTICATLVQLFHMRLAWVGRKRPHGEVEIIGHDGAASDYVAALRTIGIRWDNSPLGRGPAGTAMRSGEIQYANIDEQPFRPWREAAQRHGLHATISLPLLIKGEVYGALTLYSEQHDAFASRQTVQRLQVFSNRLRVVLETAMDQQQLQLLSTALASAGNGVLITDRNGNIQWVNDAFVHLSGFDRAEAIGKTPRILKSGKHDAEYYAALWETILAGERWSCEAVEKRRDQSLYTVRQTITPIVDSGGEISHFIAIHEDVTAQKATEERIQHLAHYDALTDLPNRTLFYDRLGQAIARARRTGSQVALMFLDLDRFKQTNDTLGHLVGDQLLQQFAARLGANVRSSDTVARIGGDEFTVILPDLLDPYGASQVAEKILAAMRTPFQVDGIAINVSTSIGIAVYPGNGDNDDALLRAADIAMYQAKIDGRDGYQFYNSAHEDSHPRHTH